MKNQIPPLDAPEALPEHRAQTAAPRVILAALVATFILSGSAFAQCSSPDAGRWINTKPGGDPEQIEIYFAECGDTAGSTTRLGAKVFVRQSSGSLYQRTPVKVVYITDKGIKWLLAKVPTGGYLDKMWMRRVLSDNQEVLKVIIKHESLDSKPSATSSYIYRRK